MTGVAFIDDGSGMLPKMARYALSWGGGTHFDEHPFIGKFGFSLQMPQSTRLSVSKCTQRLRMQASSGRHFSIPTTFLNTAYRQSLKRKCLNCRNLSRNT